MADLIKSGRRCHATGKYKRALTFFTKAMRSCPCSSGTKLDKCTCRDFEKIASQGGSIFKEAVEICPCNVGILFKKCDNSHHIQALDFRAATYEALGKLDQAIKDAEWILELAPRLPDGYLCLGRIARQQKKDEYAWKVYTAGIEAMQDSAVDSSPKLQELYRAREPLHWRFSRRDPLSLPSELVTQIFLKLRYGELFPCLRVCKRWKRTLTSPLHSPLWRTIDFPLESKRGPLPDELRRVISWAGPGGAKIICLTGQAQLTQETLTLLLRSSPSLEILYAWRLPEGCVLPLDVKPWNRLGFVHIRNLDTVFHPVPVDHPGGFPKTFLQNAANSLEDLYFKGIPEQWFNDMTSIPRLHNLKSLAMDHYFQLSRTPFRIFALAIAFPRLEQLQIGPDLPSLDPGPVVDWPNWWERMWPHLKVLQFDTYEWADNPGEYDLAERTRSTLRYLMCLNRGKSLQHIHFRFPRRRGRCILSDNHDLIPGFDVTQHSEFQNLQSFRMRLLCIPPGRARTLLRNAIQTKNLTSLDIVFPDDSLTSSHHVGEASIRHLKGYEWFRGTSTIQEVGCYGFHFRSDAENDQDMPLPQFLASFPNLRAVELISGRYDRSYEQQVELARIVTAIIRLTHLRSIYAPLFKGALLDQLRQVARDHGVEVIDERPDPWPMKLSE